MCECATGPLEVCSHTNDDSLYICNAELRTVAIVPPEPSGKLKGKANGANAALFAAAPALLAACEHVWLRDKELALDEINMDIILSAIDKAKDVL